MKLKKLCLVSVPLCCAFISAFFSCSKKAENYSSSDVYTESSYQSPRMMKMSSANVSGSASYSDSVYAADEALGSEESGVPSVLEKKLIKTGNVSVVVENLSDSIAYIESWTESFSGYVASSSASERDAYFSLKIPASRFEEAMNSAGTIGKVTSHSVNTEDVSEQFYDLKSRIENKKIMKEKLESYLKNASDIKDLLQIERELNSVVSEIDSMEGRMRRLSNQIDYSTLSVRISLPANRDEHGFIFPDISGGFSDFLSLFVGFIFGFIRVFFMIILFGIPILAALAFFYWLLFGRVGFAVKLFRFLKGEKTESKSRIKTGETESGKPAAGGTENRRKKTGGTGENNG